MAVPKKKRSRSRKSSKLAAYLQRVQAPTLTICSHCKQAMMPHRVCPFCGYYKGKKVIDLEARDKKKREKLKSQGGEK